ncbi:ParB/RepB/Spo0J family partition protein [Janibacter alittae]|uniref:ParB/RepB/Spo0J family partition protein n=1 Tax=Janibacter alittae TaxID=3115209 RepID=A0ABZ2MLJ3_9MICO
MSTTTTHTVGQVVEVDPKTLTIGANVRLDTHPKAKEFTASIKARGVIEAITAHEDEDGTLVVQRGQRRTLAAAEVGTPSGTVPVRIVEPPEETDRIIDQMSENIHRTAMHESELRDGVEQLALLGVSAAQIAKRTAVKRETVKAALAVVGSDATRERMDSQGLTLAQAAALAEFEADDVATARLARSIEWGHPIDHAVQRLRDERAEREGLKAEAERLRAEGVPALDPDDCPAPGDLFRMRLDNLVTIEGEEVTNEQREGLPGLAVVVSLEWEYPNHDDEDEDEEQPEEAREVYVHTWVCTDPEAAGLRYRYQRDSRGPSPVAEADPAAAEAQAEAERQERRLVRENNAAWRSAETVRRQWLAGFVTRKTPPKGAEAVICEAMIIAPHSLTRAMQNSHAMLRSTLGSESELGDYRAVAAECATLSTQPATAKALTMRTLAAVLLAWEDSTDVHTWRNPSTWDRRVMAVMTGWGYEASEVEQLLTATDEDEEVA